ncbi:peptide-N4-asparagine amidase [Streptomyces chryseus]|uniref:peptide-N4-asparagine amidase n=1 Tax=Streptomyces chryseus TaxID=68186 RepID=UPI001E60C5B3|nr:peptide-N4-asparagine amidase [Streptomyces chryseus]
MRRPHVMGTLLALVLAALPVTGAGRAGAATPAAEAAAATHGAGAAAAEPPREFGNDWHDPVTAAPPVATPGTRSCEVKVAHARFRDFTPYKGGYAPPKGCGDRWSKVVLRLEGEVAGRQYDRLGHLHIGGVEVLRTSTPQPSPEGITWSVEKDVTRYSDILRRAQPVEMLIGNVVDETYTGVIDVEATLTFYAAEGRTRPAATPDRVLTLDGQWLTTPRNSERVVAEVYATGSGGGCEEYWYLSVPEGAPYSCRTPDGPYREVQIKVDGQLAGIAAPFPTVWTGGWSNPFLWYVIPGPRAFDVKPVQYDLTPFAGRLNDGRPHRVEVSVVGVPEGQTGWSTPVNVLVWQDRGSEVVTGALTRHDNGVPANSSAYTPGSEHRVDTRGGHRLTVSGHLNTSRGRVVTTVDRTLAHTSVHRWTDGGTVNTDALKGTWTDRKRVTTDGRGPATAVRAHRTYTMDGTTTLGADDRLRTVLALGDRAGTAVERAGKRLSWSRLDDTYEGDATYTANVPRDQRHAVGTSSERYRLYGTAGCHDRTVETAQGTVTRDRLRCGRKLPGGM